MMKSFVCEVDELMIPYHELLGCRLGSNSRNHRTTRRLRLEVRATAVKDLEETGLFWVLDALVAWSAGNGWHGLGARLLWSCPGALKVAYEGYPNQK